MWKEFEFGDECSNVLYLIDSNMLIDMSRLYYRGRCIHLEETDDLKRFIVRARRYGIQNQFALIESCFNWNTNQLNSSRMQKIMRAFDALVVYMSDEEIEHHIGVLEPFIEQQEIESPFENKSIFNCGLPKMIFENSEMRYLFYIVYCICLKMRILYNDTTIGCFDKVKELYEFMINDVDLFLDKEFFLATQLFIGKDDGQKIAKDILKIGKSLDVKIIVNSAMDIFQYRMVCLLVETTKSTLNLPVKIVFVTGDVALQNYMEAIKTLGIIRSQNMITPCDRVSFDVNSKYEQVWEEFYNEHIWPELKKRAIESHVNNLTDYERHERFLVIKGCIENMEKTCF